MPYNIEVIGRIAEKLKNNIIPSTVNDIMDALKYEGVNDALASMKQYASGIKEMHDSGAFAKFKQGCNSPGYAKNMVSAVNTVDFSIRSHDGEKRHARVKETV